MKKEEMKLFVAGYYDDRIFEREDGECYDTPLYSNDVGIYNINEVLNLGFMSGFEEELYEQFEQGLEDFNKLSFEERKELIINYCDSDEIAGIEFFETEDEAIKYKQQILDEIAEIENETKYSHTIIKNGSYGSFSADVYVTKR